LGRKAVEDGEVASREGKAEEQKREKYQEEREGGGAVEGERKITPTAWVGGRVAI